MTEPAPSPAAKRAGVAILRAASSGAMSRGDLHYLAGVLSSAGERVELPPPPRLTHDVGWLVVRRVRCSSRGCRCRQGGPLHGPYVYRRWLDGDRTKEEYLGRLGRARAPTRLADQARAEIEAQLRKLDERFLHAD